MTESIRSCNSSSLASIHGRTALMECRNEESAS
jgi:hypothetical protein